ncbi:MAG: hypothetical protein AB7F32_10385 [Victivallaceae bacterium]
MDQITGALPPRRPAGTMLSAGCAATAIAVLAIAFGGNPARLWQVIAEVPNYGLPLLLPGLIPAGIYLIRRRRQQDWLHLGCAFAVWTVIVYSGIYLAADRVCRRECDYYRARIAGSIQVLGPQVAAARLAELRNGRILARTMPNSRKIATLSQRLELEDHPNLMVGLTGIKVILLNGVIGLALLTGLLIMPKPAGRTCSRFALAGSLLFFAVTVMVYFQNDRRIGEDFAWLSAGIEAEYPDKLTPPSPAATRN